MKRQSLLLSMALIAAFVLSTLVPGCSFDQSNDPTTSSSATIKTALAGQVVDENGKPIPGATVSAYGKSITTTAYGTFLLSDVDVPKERCIIKVSKNGFFNAFRAEEPKANSITQVRIGLMSNAPQGSFAATAGKNVTLPSNASVALPANGYVTENGTAYSGQVRYAIRHLDPTSQNFYDFFAGDFQGRASDGSVTNMLSYGVLRVELSGNNGEKLNLGNGAKATLTVPIPASMKSAPASLPLWSFDEASGMWKEEAVATKNGDVYTGAVSHFSEWNFDAKTDPATLVIRVHCGGEIVPNLIVKVGERTVTSDNELIRIRNVQGGVPIAIKVYAQDNNGIESAEQVVTLVANEVKNIDLPLITCPAFISGSLENCENQKMNGTIVGDYADGSSFYGFARNGDFKIRVKTGETMTLKAIADNAQESDVVSVPALALSQVYPVGTLLACKGNAIITHDYDLGLSDFEWIPLQSVISKDGSKLVTTSIDRKARVLNTSDGSLINEVALDNTVGRDSVGGMDVSDDASIMLVSTSYMTFHTYNLNTSQKMAKFENVYSAYLSPDGSKVIALKYENNESIVELFNAADGSSIRTYTSVNGKPFVSYSSLAGFLNNDQFALIAREDNREHNLFYALKVSDGSIVSQVNLLYDQLRAISPDGSLITVFDSQNSKLNFYSTQNGQKTSSVSLPGKEFSYSNPFAITPDNRRFVMQFFASNQQYSTPALYNVSNGILNKPLPSPGSDIQFSGYSFSADGKKLAGTYRDATTKHWMVRIWEL